MAEVQMQKISEVAGDRLKWAQPSALRRHFELKRSEELIAQLQFRSVFGTLATAESGDGCWTFKRVGFWQQKVTVRADGSEDDLAVFRNNTWKNGGTLEFPNGRRFPATTNFWSTKFAFENDAGETLVRFHYGGVFRLSADVEILQPARTMAELPILVLFGWYLAVMLHMDSGAAAAAAAAG